MTTNEVSLNSPKLFIELLRHLLILQVDSPPRFSLLTVYSRLRVGSLNSLSLPDNFDDHLPQERQILHLLGLSGLLSHSVFWDIFLMHLTCPILYSQQSEHLLLKLHPRAKHVL